MARNKYDIDETLESPFDIRHFKRAGKYVRKYKWEMILALVASLLSSVAGLFVVTLTGRIIDRAIPEKDTRLILTYGAILMGCIAVSVILAVVRMRTMAIVGQKIVFDMRNDLYAHLQKLSFSYFDSRPHGKILVRVINYINSVADILSNGIVNFILEMFNIVIILVFMLLMNVKLTLVTLAGVPIIVAIAFLIRPPQMRAWRRFSNKNSNTVAFFSENINGIKVTQSFAREEYNTNICRRLSDAVRSAWTRAVMYGEALNSPVDAVNNAVTCAIYAVGAAAFGGPAVTLGTIVTMTGYSARFWQPFVSLAVIFNSFVTSVAYLERIFEMMDEKVEITDAPDAKELPQISGCVEFRDVHFSYETGTEVLHGISFTARPGQSIALVGPTGSGKSTIVNLLSRFYDVDSGSVLIDGCDVRKVTVKSLRSQMGVMMQDSFIFSGSIADNIRYGRLDADISDIEKAARAVDADAFIKNQPKGYDTQVSERGTGLSQGQKQLIAFARTIVSDPRILILDEATSSIDTKTERQLQKGIDGMLHGRTSFIIAHRLSTIRSCDRIMYIDHGRIVESGSHDELIKKKGAYYNLVNAHEEKDEKNVVKTQEFAY